MNENAACQKIIRALNAIPGCRAIKRHGGKFSSGEPDISGVFNGRAFFIEVKLERGKLTALQANSLDKWRDVTAKTWLFIYRADSRKRNIKPIFLHDTETWSKFVGIEVDKIECISSPLRVTSMDLGVLFE